MAVRPVLLLTNELATVSAVTSALESNGRLAAEDVFRGLSELNARLASGAVPAVLVDIDEQSDRLLAALEPLVRKFADTRFIVLSGQMSQDLLLGAMQAGARHFLVKQSIASDLSGVLHRLCPPTEPATQGRVVTVFSGGGGCGATTIAVNLAAELPLSGGSPDPSLSLIVDFDRSYGAVGAYLGAEADYGVLDLLNRSGPLDAQLISSAAVTKTGHPAAILSTVQDRLGQASPVDPHRIGPLIDACKAAYLWTTVDAPRVSMDVAAQLAAHSDVTLLLMQLTVKDIRVARQMLSALAEGRMTGNPVWVVVNRYRKRGSLITLEEARSALKLSEAEGLTCLCSDYHAVTQAANLGRPLAQGAPRSDFRRDLQKLAARILALQPSEKMT